MDINQRLFKILIIFSVIGILYFLAINLFLLNKGFSLWDESYYLLSYKMAFEGFYPHFTNTPFLVSKMFEWFHPGLIGYRIIHLLLSLISSSTLTLMVITYLETTTLKLKSIEKVFLASLPLHLVNL